VSAPHSFVDASAVLACIEGPHDLALGWLRRYVKDP
jgi:hypothetical protein